ncbi:MAG: hypothetical protein ACI9TY_001541 [Alphaproteobacteria bacterium]|jgi:hypothetical protein
MNIKSVIYHLIFFCTSIFTAYAFVFLANSAFHDGDYIYLAIVAITGSLATYVIIKDFRRSKKRTKNFTICPIKEGDE